MLDKIQAKTTYTVLGIVFLGVAILIGVMALIINSNHRELSSINKQNSLMIHRIDNITALQDNVVEDILSYTEGIRDQRQRQAIEEMSMDHFNNVTALNKNIADARNNMGTINRIVMTSNIMVIAVIVIVLIQGIVLYLIGLRIGNRISGPLVVISRFLRDFNEGKEAVLRPIRKEDELQEFYSLFAQAVDKVRGSMTAKK